MTEKIVSCLVILSAFWNFETSEIPGGKIQLYNWILVFIVVEERAIKHHISTASEWKLQWMVFCRYTYTAEQINLATNETRTKIGFFLQK